MTVLSELYLLFISEIKCESYLDHGDILLWCCRLNPVGHLNHSFNQSCHILIHFVVRTIQVGGGRRTDLLRLQLDQRRENSFLSKSLMREVFFSFLRLYFQALYDKLDF